MNRSSSRHHRLALLAVVLFTATPSAFAQAPVITAGQTFSIVENSISGSFPAIQMDSGTPDSFMIDTTVPAAFNGTFFFDQNNLLSVASSANLDFETAPGPITLTIRATENGETSLPATIEISIVDSDDVLNVNENAPNQSRLFSLPVDSGAFVTGVDGPPGATFAITDGNPDGIFAINPTTGIMTLVDTSLLDHETTASYTIEVTVTDAGTPAARDITVNILDDDEPPVRVAPDPATFPLEIAENSTTAAVTTIDFDDPDTDARAVTYSIASVTGSNGNDLTGAFAIDSSSGAFTVADTAFLDYETFPPGPDTPSFVIRVVATEVGATNPLSSALEVTIDLTDVDPEPLVLPDGQSYTFNEDSDPIGTLAVINGEGRGKSFAIAANGQTDRRGNPVDYFQINSSSGEIRLSPDSVGADFTLNNPFSLTVEVSPDTPLTGEADPATTTVEIRYVSDTVPGGSPFLLPVGDYLVDLAPGNAGEVYALVRTSGSLELWIYDEAFTGINVVTVTSSATATDTVESLSLTPDHIVVAYEATIKRYDRADPDAAPTVTSLEAGSTVRDMITKQVREADQSERWYAYLCGKDPNGRFFWQRFTLDDMQSAGGPHRWGFSTGDTDFTNKVYFWAAGEIDAGQVDITSTANYNLYSIAVDSDGAAYVSGTFRDPIPDLLMGRVGESYGHSLNVPGVSGQSLLFGRGNYLLPSFIFLLQYPGPDHPDRYTGFIYKFGSDGSFLNGIKDGGGGIPSYTQSYVRDLEISEVGAEKALFAVMQFKGSGTLGIDNPSPGYSAGNFIDTATNLGNTALKVMRFDGNLDELPNSDDAIITATDASLLIDHNARELTLSADAQQNLYLTGITQNASMTFSSTSGGTSSDPQISPSRRIYYSAKLSSARQWNWVNLFGDSVYSALTSHPEGAFARWHPGQNALLFGGNLAGENPTFSLQDGADTNSISQKAFFSFITSGQELLGSNGLTIVSAFGDGGVHVLPFKGTSTVQRGESVTVSVPEEIYFSRGAGGIMTPMGTFTGGAYVGPSPQEIEDSAVMRVISTGYTVADVSGESELEDFSDDSSEYTFVFERNTKITFHWQVEYALDIITSLDGSGTNGDGIGTGAYRDAGEWRRGDATNGIPGLGLTSTAAGNPNPVVKKHWVAENEIVTAFIDGKVDDLQNIGTRYLVDGWHGTGSAAGRDTQDLSLQARHQVPQFVMNGPASLTYQWRIQHRVQVSTSNTVVADAPQVRLLAAGSVDLDEGANGFGSGEHWFDRGTAIRVGSYSTFNGKDLTGWLNASSPFSPEFSPSSLPGLGTLPAAGGLPSFRYIDVAAGDFTEPIRTTWNFSDTIYRTVTSIGELADIINAQDANQATLGLSPVQTSPGSGEIKQPDRVTVVDSPPGSTGNDMQVWDDVAHQLLPLRPGIFFLEWDIANSDDKIVVQVASGFPGDPVPGEPLPGSTLPTVFPGASHFTHLYAPDLPPVALDPDPEDSIAFQEFQYTSGNAIASEGFFTSSENGKAVLLFSRSDTPKSSGGAATGDLTRETLQVRVAETIVWEEGLLDESGVPAPIANPLPTVIGGTEYDQAAINTGFVVYPLARYNANIYDRTRVADAGPIIPVNRHFDSVDSDGINRSDLIVFWYEKKNAILWPYASAQYDPVWPEGIASATPAPPTVDEDYFRRIVIASRLGSEGVDKSQDEQLSFSPDRFSDVTIYNQPNPTLPGYNPNEEHALIAPSFKFLDQANPPPTAYALRRDLNITTQGPTYTSDHYVLVEYFDAEAGEDGAFRMAVYEIEYDDPSVQPEEDANGRSFPYVFNYEMTAGEPVQPPYPLGLVIGLTPCKETFGFNLPFDGPRVYWEDHKGQPWAVSKGRLASYFYYPQALDFWNGSVPPGTCLPFLIQGSIEDSVTGQTTDPRFDENGVSYQLRIGDRTVTLTGTTAASFVDDFNLITSNIPSTAADSDLRNVTAELIDGAKIRIVHANGGSFRLQDGPGRPLERAGLRYVQPGVIYRVSWPKDTPILKAGETLTFQGGEWKADHPEAPGLPGVIGWAAGTVVFDSLNPTMDGSFQYNNPDSYTARIVAPLETLEVDLDISPEERTAISPATGLTKVDRTVWRFTGLSASLQKRIFYDPLDDTLGMNGFVNDKTLGDDSLTAAPAPVYVLEPNILTTAERAELLTLPGIRDALRNWDDAVNALFDKGRDPNNLRPGEGYMAGLVADTLSGGLFTSKDVVPVADDGGNLEDTYFLIYNPDKSIWVWLDFDDAKYSGSVVEDIESDGFDAGDPDWDKDEWVGEDDVITHQVVFTSGTLDGRRYDITSNDGDDLDLDGSFDSNDLSEGDTFRIVEKNASLAQPGVLGGFSTVNVSELSQNSSAETIASRIEEAINERNNFLATRDGNRLTITYNGEPTAPRDGNTGFSFPDTEGEGANANETVDDTAVPGTFLGPGLALVPSPAALDPASTFQEGYVTIVENDDADVGGPVSLFIIKVSKEHRYRGAIKTILSDNVFDEKITLRHTGDFGANADQIVYQWFYREEDGSGSPLPPNAAWKIFPDQSDNDIKGLGVNQVSLEGAGGLLLADNLFFVRYRHVNDQPADGPNAVTWGPVDSDPANAETGVTYTDWWTDGLPRLATIDNGLQDDEVIGELFAGAGNSPTVDGDYKPQLVQGWIKRVLDRVNPYEARFNDFRSNSVPATYVSMIQQTGPPFVGPVALNPDKNVIENVGLLELYHTIFERGKALSIDLSSPITTPGINNALLLASSRLSDLYMLLGNEAYSDSLDPTIGFGSNSAEFGHATPSIFSFQNQMGSLLDEELSLLRGVDESFARPVFNRLFWNFTKSEGEVAYAVNYNVTDQNLDGFIDESDAMILYPQGHGDAWGHYLSAMRQQYELLKNPFFNWISRSESYNLLDIVISVDFEDERKFATAAAAKARAGADIVNQTYRSRYVPDPDGQWQGYTDPDEDRGWGVQGWARRTGQGALFDWVTANAILPDENPERADLVNESLSRIDRTTVTAIGQISSYHGKIQGTYDNANQGLNPLGLADEVVPFDIDPAFDIVGSGIQGQLHFEQIYERAQKAAQNALTLYDAANAHANQVRNQQITADDFYQESYEQDRTIRNELIEIFGTPYEGTIGPGLPYPSGYKGPDINLWFYVDVAEVSDRTVPQGSGSFAAAFSGFKSALALVEDERVDDESIYQFDDSNYPFFVNDVLNADDFDRGLASNLSAVAGMTQIDDDGNLFMDLPVTAEDYTFKAPRAWGRRAAPGELQAIIAEMLIAEAEVALAQGDYDNYIKELVDMSELLVAKSGVNADLIQLKQDNRTAITTLNGFIQGLKTTAAILNFNANIIHDISEATGDSIDVTIGLSNTPFKPIKGTILAIGATTQYITRIAAFAFEQVADILEISKERRALTLELDMDEVEMTFEIREQIKEIEQHLRNEATTRIEIFTKIEALREISDRYRATLERGLALLDEREDFNKFTAATTQQTRYQDMAFRHFRNGSLEKYRDAFDLAARYAYLAAKAYDYDTNLSPIDPYSAQGLFDDVIKARHLGGWSDGEPRIGSGLAGALATMRDNYDVHKTQLGLNNFQQEVNKMSLREGHFRNKKNLENGTPDSAISNGIWRQILQDSRVADLWSVPEFRRYCRPPQAEGDGPLPGLVLEFPTEIIFGRNVFGWPLGGGDFSYDPTYFATKIRGAGIWFEGYNQAALSVAPRVYLVPAGLDVMTIPNSDTLETRRWNVVDQSIPPPFVTTDTDIADPDYIPTVHSLDGPFAEIRKFSSMRAFPDMDGTPAFDDQMTYNSRLIGRSAWNTRWLLIIPGGTLSADANAGLDQFIQDVSDIKLLFHTLGYSGN